MVSIAWHTGPWKRIGILGLCIAQAILITLGVAAPSAHALAAAAASDDWPMYQHDATRTAASGDMAINRANAAQLTTAWTFQTGGPIAAQPAIVNGVVYIGSWDGYEYALNAATGALIWKTFLGQTNDANCNPKTLGITSSAAVQNGVVYVGGGATSWYALNANSGAVLWQVGTGDNSPAGGHYNWSSPLLVNGFAYIGIASNCDNPLVQGQLLQVNLATHVVTATFNVVPAGQAGGGIWTTPAYDAATNTLYVATGNESQSGQPLARAMLALDATTLNLKDSWQLPANEATQDSDWSTTPVLFPDANGRQLVEVTNKNGYSYVWDRSNLAAGPVWQTPIANAGTCPECGDGSVSSGAFADGALYVAGGSTTINGAAANGSVRSLQPSTGATQWQHAAGSPVIPAIIAVNGLVIDAAGKALEVLDDSNGATLFTANLAAAMYGAPSVAEGHLYATTLNGSINAFAPANQPAPQPPPPTPAPPTAPTATCPTNWSCVDVGAPALAGSQQTSQAQWQVQGAGNDIWDVADQFRFIAYALPGDGVLSARVVSQTYDTTWAKAGVMLRQSNDPGAPFYAVLVTPASGIVVQYRLAQGATAQQAALANGTAPIFLRVVRAGTTCTAQSSTDGATWTDIAGAATGMPTFTGSVLAGLAVTSHNPQSLSTVVFASIAAK